MSFYLSDQLLRLAFQGFNNLNPDDDVKQGVTQNVSAIRHCLALDQLLKKHSLESAKLQHQSDPHIQEFKNNVGEVVLVKGNDIYTTNLINDLKTKLDFGVGSNLISAGVATHSRQSIQNYPKKANKGLISIDDYEFSLLDDYVDKLKDVYKLSELGFSLLIWLGRFVEFDKTDLTAKQLFSQLKQNVEEKYSDSLAKLITYSTAEAFQEYVTGIDELLSKNKPNLVSLFEQSNKPETPSSSANSSTVSTIAKPFILLAGISGTGKTRFIREQAKSTGSLEDTYCLVSVRPDWHEPSDLLGYVSRLSGSAEYRVTDVLKFIVRAWIEIANAGPVLMEKQTHGEQSELQEVRPFWLCLDEMNLAPVEQYFADYLSVLETREWVWNDGTFVYKCDALLKATMLDSVDHTKLKRELCLEENEELWEHFIEHGIGIPFNLIVAGTVNMDETTHGFSRKVIDRALTFDFGEFFPSDFEAFFEPKSKPKMLTYPIFSDGRNKDELSNTFDKYGKESISFLKQVNTVLEYTPFQLAYRSLNELLLSVIAYRPQTEIELLSVWDDFLMCKVLPRIEGDIDKLTRGENSKNILEELSELLSIELAAIWDKSVRLDLLRESLGDEVLLTIECRSKTKIELMNSQLNNGFTSFWP